MMGSDKVDRQNKALMARKSWFDLIGGNPHPQRRIPLHEGRKNPLWFADDVNASKAGKLY
jgi:hypothetical protein